jgi:hypothetical protein
MFLKADNRWQAFGLHLLASIVMFLVLAAIIYFSWYPGILFHFDGGFEGMRLIAGVDFFIGPLLTLLVYKVGKKHLKLDLVLIALLQVSCLAGGMWTIWQTRPVAVVYANGEFRSIGYQVYSDYGVVPDAVPLLQQQWPVWVAVTDDVSHTSNLFGDRLVDPKAHFKVEGYVPFKDYLFVLPLAGRVANQLPPDFQQLAGELEKNNPSIRFYRATLGAGGGFLAVDSTNGQAETFLPLIPREVSISAYLNKSKVLLMNFINGLLKNG